MYILYVTDADYIMNSLYISNFINNILTPTHYCFVILYKSINIKENFDNMNTSKKEYTTPECSVIMFDTEDVITTSGGKLNAYEVDAISNNADLSFDNFFNK